MPDFRLEWLLGEEAANGYIRQNLVDVLPALGLTPLRILLPLIHGNTE